MQGILGGLLENYARGYETAEETAHRCAPFFCLLEVVKRWVGFCLSEEKVGTCKEVTLFKKEKIKLLYNFDQKAVDGTGASIQILLKS